MNDARTWSSGATRSTNRATTGYDALPFAIEGGGTPLIDAQPALHDA